jgi:hypothetical protein
LPDAVIRIGDGKAEEEAIAEAMDDDDNAAIVDSGAADGEHTSLPRR